MLKMMNTEERRKHLLEWNRKYYKEYYKTHKEQYKKVGIRYNNKKLEEAYKRGFQDVVNSCKK